MMPLPGAASVEVATSSAKNSLGHSSETAPRSSVAKQQNPSRIQAQTRENHRPQNCLALRSEALKKDDAMMPLPGAASVEVATSSAKNSLEHSSETAPRSPGVRGCETAEPQQDSSPNLRKPSPAKVPNVAFWSPKERWCNDAIAWSGPRGTGHFIRKELSGA